jgi:hypothetical protein
MYTSNQNQEIVRLILRLRALEQEYPNQMMSARRVSYRTLVAKRLAALIRLRRQMIVEYNKQKVSA